MFATIITPTAEREAYLRFLYKTILSLKYEGGWEWRILDNSWRPSSFFQNLKDNRVHYTHTEKSLTIGEKRNWLKNEAKGDFIVHFDDDDYYAPNYLNKVNNELQNCDFFKLSSFFCYSASAKEFFYWDTSSTAARHFVVSPLTGKKVQEIDFSHQKGNRKLIEKNKKGYGFSFAYKKKIGETLFFRKINLGEDYSFLVKAEKEKYKISFCEDKEGLAIHIIHDMNTSLILPQFHLPPFVANNFFPPLTLKGYPYKKNQGF